MTNVLSLSGRISHLEAVPIILVYNYLLSSCHCSSNYISYNMGNWGKGMDCGSFLVGEAGWFCEVFKLLHLLHWLLLCSCSCICSYPWVQLSLYASYAGNIWIALNHDSWCRDQPWESPSVIYFLIIQLSAAVLSLVEVFGSRIHQDSCWLNFSFDIEQIG